MNRKMLLGIACAGVCAVSGNAFGQVPELYNGGFEISFPGFPTAPQGWRIYQVGQTQRREIGDGLTPPTQVHSGTASMILPGGNGQPAGEFQGILAEEFVPGVLPPARNWPEYTFNPPNGDPLRFGFWFMIPAEDPVVGQRAGLFIGLLRSGDNFSFYYSSETLDIDPDPAAPLRPGTVRVTTPAGPGIHTNGQWVEYVRLLQQSEIPTEALPPTNPARATMRIIRFGSANSTGTMWVDDATFDQVGGGNPCPADHNGQNGVTVQDIYDFLADWSAGLPAADFNGQNGVTVQDIYDFLSAWSLGNCT